MKTVGYLLLSNGTAVLAGAFAMPGSQYAAILIGCVAITFGSIILGER